MSAAELLHAVPWFPLGTGGAALALLALTGGLLRAGRLGRTLHGVRLRGKVVAPGGRGAVVYRYWPDAGAGRGAVFQMITAEGVVPVQPAGATLHGGRASPCRAEQTLRVGDRVTVHGLACTLRSEAEGLYREAALVEGVAAVGLARSNLPGRRGLLGVGLGGLALALVCLGALYLQFVTPDPLARMPLAHLRREAPAPPRYAGDCGCMLGAPPQKRRPPPRFEQPGVGCLDDNLRLIPCPERGSKPHLALTPRALPSHR